MIERILVGTVTSDATEGALQLAAELATRHDAELHVLRLEPLLDARQVFDPEGVPAGVGSPENDLRMTYPGLRLRSSQARGNPVRTVCAVAEDEQPDLIVVGHGRTRRGRAVLSRRASNTLVERAPCAVLLVAS